MYLVTRGIWCFRVTQPCYKSTFAAGDGVELLLALDAAEAVPVVVADAGHHLLGLEHLWYR